MADSRALVRAVANFDANIVAPALEPDRFGAVVSRRDLSGKIVHREPERPGFGFQFQSRLVFSRREVRTHLVYAVKPPQPIH